MHTVHVKTKATCTEAILYVFSTCGYELIRTLLNWLDASEIHFDVVYLLNFFLLLIFS